MIDLRAKPIGMSSYNKEGNFDKGLGCGEVPDEEVWSRKVPQDEGRSVGLSRNRHCQTFIAGVIGKDGQIIDPMSSLTVQKPRRVCDSANLVFGDMALPVGCVRHAGLSVLNGAGGTERKKRYNGVSQEPQSQKPTATYCGDVELNYWKLENRETSPRRVPVMRRGLTSADFDSESEIVPTRDEYIQRLINELRPKEP